MTKNGIFNEKSKNFNITIFSIFSKSCDFACFAKENRLYFDKVTTDFDFKTRFGKFIRFYYEVWNMKIQFEIILVVYGDPRVDFRWKISNLSQMFDSQKIKYRDPFSHIYDLMGSYWIVLIRLHEKLRMLIFFRGFWLEIDRILMMADLVSVF
jgi:hypothetical protein